MIMGAKYPKNKEEFVKSRLDGEFDPEMAGKRMKLPSADTWEAKSTQEGNGPDMWQSLIDANKLPFMAMLRNLRAMLKCGISEEHFNKIITRLCDARAVTSSRQLPFRFLSSYYAVGVNIRQLNKNFKSAGKRRKKLRAKFKQTKNLQNLGRLTAEQFAVEERKYKKVLASMPQSRISAKRIKLIKDALSTSVDLAARHNLPELEGRTIICVDISKALRKPCTMGQTKRLAIEVGVLLGLMIYRVNPSKTDFWLFSSSCQKYIIRDPTKNILELLDDIMKMTSNASSKSSFPYETINKAFHQQDLHRLIVISDMNICTSVLLKGAKNPLLERLEKYRKACVKDMVFVCIDIVGSGKSLTDQDEYSDGYNPKNVLISGYSESILRFLPMLGGGQLNEIEEADSIYLNGPRVAESSTKKTTD
eukprot:CAMPEP_0168520622 /NCGR_PEP_ID=MMETSP0405-20121227/8135_1 /TAXON_ID=498012 /ORGANISM="Trichosphaerium sp, Strain Am-I-7 wt" /LENGTH=419 /DNA_ID=CAMNT_0008541615 /DNA_START=59 /DNA_END=1318 /DNA_ORIENTATION=+